MNGFETANAQRLAVHERAVHLVDAVAIRRALLGDPVALTELEYGACVVICDRGGLNRELVARGLGVGRRRLEREVAYKRRDLPAVERELLAAELRPVAAEFAQAVERGDAAAVAGIAAGLDAEGWCALALNLAADLVEARAATGEGAVS